ncbi:DUF1778 domain-containing protein [Aquitalea magnusonii]|uniref:Uncharacterized protein (DUF1778 family) n=1 Tax=Aquitalea magnusonii TaxID=332411 RepID=A0A318J4P7_9NEIS|nr:DUF1778 domain-containing protein [Aquitalea magnusonii]PXX42754.1 uncharacterized protein (DUF1778 family) [Aquitalea magnusonii]
MANSKLQDATVSPRGRITARVPQHVEKILQEAAELAGATLNQFVVQAALAAAEQLIERERVIHLSGENAAWLCQLLDHPPSSAALQAAFQQYQARKGEHEGSDTSLEFEP